MSVNKIANIYDSIYKELLDKRFHLNKTCITIYFDKQIIEDRNVTFNEYNIKNEYILEVFIPYEKLIISF